MIGRLPRIDLYALILVASIVGFPFLASITGILGLDSAPYSITFRGLVLAAAIVVIVKSFWQSGPLRLNGLFYFFLLFWIIYALRITYDTQYYAYLLSRPAWIYWAFGIGTCFIPAMALAIAHPTVTADDIFRTMLFVAVIALVLGSLSANTEVTNAVGNTYDTGRFQLESLNAISLGHLAVTVMLLAYWRLRNGSVSLSHMLQYILLFSLGLLGLALSSSRGPVLALLCAIFFAEMAKRGWLLIAFLVSFALLLPLLTIDLNHIDIMLGTNTFGRLQALWDGGDTSTSMRLQMLSGAWQQFLANPLFGSALEERTFRIYPHNVFIESLMATGVVGGAVFSLLIFGGLIFGFRMAMAQPKLGWIAILYCQYFVASLFSSGLYSANSMWTLLGVIIMHSGYQNSKTNSVPNKHRLQAG
ncbi:MAG: O-antigen ligase family protein [Parasphingorhabdus sp.]